MDNDITATEFDHTLIIVTLSNRRLVTNTANWKGSVVAHPPLLEEQLAYVIACVNRQLEEHLQRELRPEGLPLEQFRVLAALHSSDGQPMSDLAAAVLVDPATLTKIIDRMVAEALVYRSPAPSDRRRVLIFRANKGIELYSRLQNVATEQQRTLLERLDEKKAKQLTRLLKELF